MRFCGAVLLVLSAAVLAQSRAPSFTADRVLPSGRDRATPLSPGLFVSIYGEALGPLRGCLGKADPQRREAFHPRRPPLSFAETLIYPKELCGVEVLVGGQSAGLLYVQDQQINFKVPLDAPLEGMAELKVVYQGSSSPPVHLPLGPEAATLLIEGTGRVGGPVWIKIEGLPAWASVQYPVTIHPGGFGCHELEVRQNGVLLPRIALPGVAQVHVGLACGNIGIAGHAMPHPGRLPLHLQYRFEKPGTYEVRYTRRRDVSAEALFRSVWTRIEVLDRAPRRHGALPADPAEVLSDFLPGVLGFADAASLPIVSEALYHPHETVRQYAALGLSYWADEEVHRRLVELLRTKGPSDAVVERTIQRSPELIDAVLPHLKSENPVLLRGAITGVYRLLAVTSVPRAEAALIAAVENVVRVGDEQTQVSLAAALGVGRDARGRDVLWDFVKRRVAIGQSVIAITWRKDPSDLARLAALLEAPVTGDPLSGELSSLPHALRRTYGEASLPFLESALKKSGYVWVQTGCARELILAGRASGFLFIAEAMEQGRFYKREMVEFVRGQFPELREADDGAILAFLKQRAL